MKIKAISAILAVVLAIGQTALVFAENENVEISFKVGDSVLDINGTKTEVETPYITGIGTTLVPLRVITEAFGSQVEWDGEEKKITLTYPGVDIVLHIGSNIADVNESDRTLPEAPVLSPNGVTMVPLRFISEEFGAEVRYDEGLITVTKNTVSEPIATPEAENKPEHTEKPLIESEPLITPQPAEYSGKMDFNVGVQIYPSKTGALIRLFDGFIDDEDLDKDYNEWGVHISKDRVKITNTDKLVAKRVEETMSNGETIISYVVDCKKSGMTLEPDTTYYLLPYGVKDGAEHRHRAESFKTLSSKSTLKIRGEVANITDTDAVLRGIVTDKKNLVMSSVNYVFYFGTSEDTMNPVVLDYKDGKIESTSYAPLVHDGHSGIHGTIGSGLKYGEMKYGEMIYNADIKEDLGVELEPDTTYYWKYMFIWDGEEFVTDTMTFTTAAAQ